MDALAADLLLKRFLNDPERARRLAPEGGAIKAVVPTTGVRSIIRVIEVDGVGRAVAKIYPPGSRRETRRRLMVDEIVEKFHLAAPRILDRVDRDRAGASLLLEECVLGEHLGPEALDAERIRLLAKVFRDLHGVTRDRFGQIDRPRSGNFARQAWRQARNRFRSVDRWGPAEIERPERRAIKRWFRRISDRFESLDSFSLIHDKPNRGNLVWQSAEGRFVLIDLATLRWGDAGKDLAQVCHEILGDEPARVEAFFSHYFGEDREEARLRQKSFAPFHHAYYHLSQCAINCRRLHKIARGGAQEGFHFSEKAVAHWRSLREIVSENALRPRVAPDDGERPANPS